MGIKVSKSDQIMSPLLKIRSVAKRDPRTKVKYQVTLVLRMNGRFEVYSDFSLVNEHYNPKLQVVDIKTDFNWFYLKFARECHKLKKEDFDPAKP